MKSVLISVRPKWCENICTQIGVDNQQKPIYKKSVEIRKTKPSCDVPFKCYIYCTMCEPTLFIFNGKIFKSTKTDIDIYNRNAVMNSKIIGEFICDYTTEYNQSDYDCPAYDSSDDELNEACLFQEDLQNYGQGKTLYGWHISDLKIYDTPKELEEFKYQCINDCDRCKYSVIDVFQRNDEDVRICNNDINRPPQSWCYVEELPE